MIETDNSQEDTPIILLVDDNAINLETLHQTLEGQGFRLLVARSGEEALRIADRAKPDLILLEFTGLDYDWPSDSVLDGETTFKVLARIPKAQGTPVLGMAAQDRPEIRDQALQSGALACLSKPLDRERLLKAVRIILEETHADANSRSDATVN